ncbi:MULTISPECIES: trehalose-phosphatase [Ramlibacter]|uniref:Trehalose 6-phosphate phosphatase n=1 Tax=Ramlibacter aquaticus TaxID=2780094 RepID=A0ABR9SBN3_9BURK|nr:MULTISPECIES: trehalose-phosphatase [Ramlibacter]MBE7939750.1 trehalose-phosphatase [Ramlibacter aquaticus]
MNLADMLAPSCALFLDFDGTLVDLAPQPEDVLVPDGLVDALQALHRALGGALAMVSGRPIAEMDAFLHPLRLPAAGVHGAQRRGADGVLHQAEPPPLDEALAAAHALAARDERLRVELKPGSIALHYRQAPEREAECVAVMQAAVARSRGLALLRGKMVVEAKPGGATKGRAIEAFLHEPPFAGRVPVFVGDDVTDEAGFSAVQRLRGLGVKVGEGDTVASRRIASPADFRAQLAQAAAALGTGAPA